MKLLTLAAFVKRGKNRRKVFEAIDKPIFPSDLVVKIYGKKTNLTYNLTSRALSQLLEAGLVKVINPDEHTGRLYQITNKGKEVKKLLLELDKA